MEYIHYGTTEFSKDKFKEIKNERLFTKPIGGLWASRVDSEYGWKNWIEDEHFRTEVYREDNYFKFKLKDEANVLVIDNAKQILDLPKQKNEFNFSFVCLDFEKLAKEYDAIEVLISQDGKLYWDLYGWDCDSILIMNKEMVEVI